MTTCLEAHWSKSGIRYLWLHKYCNCSDENTPKCRSDSWKLVFAGSRFAIPPESWYSPTEGEALPVAWFLENARMFVLGCLELIVATGIVGKGGHTLPFLDQPPPLSRNPRCPHLS